MIIYIPFKKSPNQDHVIKEKEDDCRANQFNAFKQIIKLNQL